MAYQDAHAARIDNEGIVQEVIVIPFCNDDDSEITSYCNSIGLDGVWVDTSYLGSRRKRYASPGYFFDRERDEFVPPDFELVDGEWKETRVDPLSL